MSGAVPAKIAAAFTLGELAVLSVIAREVRRLRYQRGAPIVGVRLSFTKDAKAKILPTAKAVAEPVARTVAGQSLEREAA